MYVMLETGSFRPSENTIYDLLQSGKLQLIKNERLKNLLYKWTRNLKKTAQNVVKVFKGKLPCNFEDLILLPGIGNYTANAILAIAFNKPYIPLDGNIERVLKRYLYLKKDQFIGVFGHLLFCV